MNPLPHFLTIPTVPAHVTSSPSPPLLLPMDEYIAELGAELSENIERANRHFYNIIELSSQSQKHLLFQFTIGTRTYVAWKTQQLGAQSFFAIQWKQNFDTHDSLNSIQILLTGDDSLLVDGAEPTQSQLDFWKPILETLNRKTTPCLLESLQTAARTHARSLRTALNASPEHEMRRNRAVKNTITALEVFSRTGNLQNSIVTILTKRARLTAQLTTVIDTFRAAIDTSTHNGFQSIRTFIAAQLSVHNMLDLEEEKKSFEQLLTIFNEITLFLTQMKTEGFL